MNKIGEVGEMNEDSIVIAVHPKHFREGLVDEIANRQIPEMTIACKIRFFRPWLFQYGVNNGSLSRASNEVEAAKMCSEGLSEACITEFAAANKYALCVVGYLTDAELNHLEARARKTRVGAMRKRKRTWFS